MIIDHIGKVFFPELIIFRIIGRLSFTIFAFFISEGWFYTKNKKKYAFLMFVFMLISWVPFCLALDYPLYTINVLGTFLLSIFGMFLIDKIRQNDDKKVMYICSFCMFLFVCFILEGLGILINGVLCLVLPIIFYVFKNKPIIRFASAFCVLLIIAVIEILICETINFTSFYQFFALLSLIPLIFYNNNSGRLNLKYLFYIAYPLHLFVIMLLKLI